VAVCSLIVAGIIKFSSRKSEPPDDGVITPLDGHDVAIENISPAGFGIRVNDQPVELNWSEIEFIMAYRTNKIPDSPLHIDLWYPDGKAIPLKSTMKGWKKFLEQLPLHLELENFGMLETMPFTHNVMKSAVFTLLYDKQKRDMQAVYEKYYTGN
jgi:hypothetical protein